ncbi:MAG: hypothetical protein SCK70_14725, partial [bacterium]|nr:hypothetical protein [bacterium]
MKRFTFITGLLVILFSISLVNISLAQDTTLVKQQKRLRDGSQLGEPIKQQKRLHLQTQNPETGEHGPGFIDVDGDGINDNRGAINKSANQKMNKNAGGFGAKDGSR